MKYILPLLISSIFLISCAQNEELKTASKDSNDWGQLNLIGDVKSFRETKFLAVDNFSVIEDGEKKKHTFNKEILFNLDGFKIETNDYMPDGTLATRTMYLYQNNKLKEYNSYDSQGSPFKIGKYEYNNDGEMERLVDNTSDGRYNWTKKYKYDDQGNISEVEHYKNEEIIESKEVYAYDSSKKVVASDFYKNEKLITTNNLKYDEDDNIIELNYGEASIFTYKYSYDFKGNWIKKIVFENNEPSGIIFREIEYFN